MRAILKGIKELIAGMGITGKHLGRHAITIQYPEERWPMPERSRGIVVLLSDKKTGELNCTACMLCMRACPTAAIYIDAPRGEDKKRHLKEFRLDIGLCCFCGLCEEACNFSALKMATKYEFSVENKEELIWDMRKLQDVGRDVPYVDKRKKKPAAKPKPDTTGPQAKAAESSDAAAAPEEKATAPPAEPSAAGEGEKPSEGKPDDKRQDTDSGEGEA